MASGEVLAASMRNTAASSCGRVIELLRKTGVALELAAAQLPAGENTELLPAKRVAKVVAERVAAKQTCGPG
jgi:hypothetical protein